MKNATRRNSNIELARLLSMFLIVFGHLALETKWDFSNVSVFQRAAVQSMWLGGKLGVDIFVLISGYFLSTRMKVVYKPVVKIWGQVLFYSLIIAIFSHITLNTPISLKGWIRLLFPLSTGVYWFATAYIIMVLLSPYINLALEKLSLREYLELLLTMSVLFTIATITQTQSIGFIADDAPTVIALYPFGAFIRKYKKEVLDWVSKRWLCLIIILAVAGLYSSALLIDFAGTTFDAGSETTRSFTRMFGSTSPLQLGMALSIFILFISAQDWYSPAINKLATGVFGVYLIHRHPMINLFLWNHIVRAGRYVHGPFVFFYAIFAALCVLVFGLILDYIRQMLFAFGARLISKIS